MRNLHRGHVFAWSVLVLALVCSFTPGQAADGPTKLAAPQACTAGSGDFEREVWTKVGAASCLACHRQGGEAATSAFLLVDPAKVESAQRGAALLSNHAAFTRMARIQETVDGQPASRLLLKVVGQLDHGGRSTQSPAPSRTTGDSPIKASMDAAKAVGSPTCSRPASKARNYRRRNAGVPSNGSANAQLATHGSPWR
jgi:hypothetical protein